MTMEYKDCATCGCSEQETLLNPDGNCVPCQKVLDGSPDEGVPMEAVLKLTSLAESRHPTACHEDAPSFRKVLEDEGYLPTVDR